MHDFPYLKDINTEKQIRLDGRTKPDPNASLLWQQATLEISSQNDLKILLKAFEFAKKIEYSHVGLSSEVYIAHPIRVASLALLFFKRNCIEAGIIGLLHNVFELSNINFQEISNLFGESIAIQIENLTVKRKLQWNPNYKKAYYDTINNGPIYTRVIKILDKLDNIFLLELNPDTDLKNKYLIEIETYILPMAKKDMPVIFSYLKSIIEEYKRINIK
jgi:(p)ppGpp synthase/HD superfamily hydrolase